MDSHLPAGLGPTDHPFLAGKTRRRMRTELRLRDGRRTILIAQEFADGFALDRAGPQPGPGFLDMFDGDRHVRHCKAYKTGESAYLTYYRYNTARTPAGAQPRDFAPRPDH